MIRLSVSPLGVIALKEREDELVAYRLFKGDLALIASKFSRVSNGELVDEVKSLMDEILNKGIEEVAVQPSTLISALSQNYREVSFKELEEPINIEEVFVRNGLVRDSDEYRRKVKEVIDSLLVTELKEAVARRDVMIVHAVHVLEDLDKQINMFYTRCREWYGLHFPELADLIDEPEEYMRIVAELGSRKNYTVEGLKKILGSARKAEDVLEKARISIGAEMSPEDEERVKDVAREGLRLIKLKREQENYIKELMSAEAPNLSAIAGPILGAKLIALAGGLEKLARLPASTIQVLGAEKALFRFFRTGRGAPKHGIIFQHPYVHGSPRWQRGKIARLLAAKIAIAARIDYFSREDRSSELRRALEERYAEIKQKYAQPPARKPRKRRGKRKRSRKRK
ncbi:MAG: hypothetical protein J7J19_01375 [Thaumarchaeota archaeon]|nr:hypothetical protein [Nitrososphaerota archaeon]